MENHKMLEMKYYKILNFNYKINSNFENKEKKDLTIPLKIQTSVKKIDEENLIYQIKVTIEDENNFPFKLSFAIESKFKAVNWEENKSQVELTITTILFPYVRALITNLTAAAGVQPIMLPVMNVAEMMKNQKK